jgi:hypothetical protein
MARYVVLLAVGASLFLALLVNISKPTMPTEIRSSDSASAGKRKPIENMSGKTVKDVEQYPLVPPLLSAFPDRPVEAEDEDTVGEISAGLTGSAGNLDGHFAAIIIDDVGRNKKRIMEILALGIPVTFSVLPGLDYSSELAKTIYESGQEVIIHMPMEPIGDGFPLNEKTLLITQSPEQIKELVEEQLINTPYAVGVNNHMGSLFTQDPDRMWIVLNEIRQAGLFFIDSVTTSQSVAMKTARAMGLKSAARNVFLDVSDNPDDIRKAFRETIRIAKQKGIAIAIGHPGRNTIDILSRIGPEFKEAGVTLVHASKLVN